MNALNREQREQEDARVQAFLDKWRAKYPWPGPFG